MPTPLEIISRSLLSVALTAGQFHVEGNRSIQGPEACAKGERYIGPVTGRMPETFWEDGSVSFLVLGLSEAKFRVPPDNAGRGPLLALRAINRRGNNCIEFRPAWRRVNDRA